MRYEVGADEEGFELTAGHDFPGTSRGFFKARPIVFYSFNTE
jgi:hypothetical protein